LGEDTAFAICGAAKDSSLGKIIETPAPYRNCLRLIWFI